MLEISNLGVRYGHLLAVEDVTLTVPEGQFVAIVGANGAGKSTVLKAIAGANRPFTGSIKFDDKTITKLPAYAISRLGIATVPEGRGLFARLSVDENLRLGALNRSDPDAIERDREVILTDFPALKTRLDQPAGSLSGGEQQQLSIARALLSDPKLLLIDELSLGLAPQIVMQLMASLSKRNEQGLSMLCVEQNTKVVLSYADYGYVLENGKVVQEGEGGELMKDTSLIRAYLGSHYSG